MHGFVASEGSCVAEAVIGVHAKTGFI